MENNTVAQTLDEKKATLAKDLLAVKDQWPYAERMKWCVANGYNTESIRKLYLSGSINSVPVAEALLKAINDFISTNTVTA